MDAWAPIRSFWAASFCIETVVRGRGFLFVVGFLFSLVTVAMGFSIHISYSTKQESRSKKRCRCQFGQQVAPSFVVDYYLVLPRIFFLILPFVIATLMLQKSSGMKFWICQYRSTTNPNVGNWHGPVWGRMWEIQEKWRKKRREKRKRQREKKQRKREKEHWHTIANKALFQTSKLFLQSHGLKARECCSYSKVYFLSGINCLWCKWIWGC